MVSVIYGIGVQLLGSVLEAIEGMDTKDLGVVRRALQAEFLNIFVANIVGYWCCGLDQELMSSWFLGGKTRFKIGSRGRSRPLWNAETSNFLNRKP